MHLTVLYVPIYNRNGSSTSQHIVRQAELEYNVLICNRSGSSTSQHICEPTSITRDCRCVINVSQLLLHTNSYINSNKINQQQDTNQQGQQKTQHNLHYIHFITQLTNTQTKCVHLIIENKQVYIILDAVTWLVSLNSL